MLKFVELTSKEDLTKFFEDKSAKKIIFKYSPICGISHNAEREFEMWKEHFSGENVIAAVVDVIFGKELSSIIAVKTGVVHASPQILVLDENNNVLSDTSHYSITRSYLDEATS
ncbi:MAG: hypothetical protein SCALA702_17010 [Melioribacteraceae bacterium]|nr:MAG: hypothetical protein SCALA702_17010 [Melioribacteraceae bacterium]